jgi:hypothetical protein
VELQARALNESSGIAASLRTPDVLWTHNDSGDKPRLFAFGLDGQFLAEVTLAGAKAVDWEDMCSFQVNGKPYLAVGDIGDNNRRRKSIMIYVFEEPELIQSDAKSQAARPQKIEIGAQNIVRIEVRYEQGAVDCESLAYDPLRQEFLLCTKEHFRSRLYRVPFSLTEREQTMVAQAAHVLTIPLATAADISPDGQWLIISSYGPAFVMSRDPAGGWMSDGEAMRVHELPFRRQGESICFSPDGRRLYLTSEGMPAPLWNIPFAMRADSSPGK